MSTPEPTRDYKSTVLTPKTGFPQRGSLPTREPETLQRWKEMRLYAKIAEQRRDAHAYVLHDGPPYANGHIHIGHALNKVLKDVIVRYKTMAGFRSPYVPGWDCHGLPIEQKVQEKLHQQKASDKTPLEIRRICQEYAQEWAEVQSEEFQRLGITGDWENPYLTMSREYEAATVEALATLVEKGYIFKGFKPVYWDPFFETALADAEIEYNDQHVSKSIYVRFPLVQENLPEAVSGFRNPTLVIWTTTPWTIPANMGVTLGGDLEYVGYEVGDETLIIAQGLLDAFKQETGLDGGSVVGRFRGADLERLQCAHPVFPEKRSLVMVGPHVTLEQGTGCVHTAPAHGADDFTIGQEYGLEVFNPVDEKGRYSALYPEMQGISVYDANEKLVEKFRAEGSLVWSGNYTHSYPYSWRSHKPVIMRATEQWFMDVRKDGLADKALAEVSRVEWIPKWGEERIRNMVEGRPDWCLSRQRHWGVPIPSVRDTQTGGSLLTPEITRRFAELVRLEGSDCWYARPVEDFLPESMKGEPGRYEKEYNVLDVWFDSGSSHLGVLAPREELTWPADMYLEGGDQHRGWFQHSLWIGVGVRDAAPFRAVLTHGWALDDKGRPMSKSLGNVVSPLKVIEQMGADVLRLWVTSEEYRSDVSVSQGILSQVSNVYRRIRNTIRFLLGNISDFDPAGNTVAYGDLLEDDKWLLARLDRLVRACTRAYDNYEFHRVYHLVNAFCVTDLGGIHLDCAKDRLYCSAVDDHARRSAQTALHAAAERLLAILAPILPFTSDEAWLCLPPSPSRPDSVHLVDFPGAEDSWQDDALLARWDKLLAVRSEVQRVMEPLRAKENKVIGNSLDAAVTVTTADAGLLALLASAGVSLERLFIVSEAKVVEGEPATVSDELREKGIALGVEVTRAAGAKCDRCWVHSATVGQDAEHPTLCARCADVIRRSDF